MARGAHVAVANAHDCHRREVDRDDVRLESALAYGAVRALERIAALKVALHVGGAGCEQSSGFDRADCARRSRVLHAAPRVFLEAEWSAVTEGAQPGAKWIKACLEAPYACKPVDCRQNRHKRLCQAEVRVVDAHALLPAQQHARAAQETYELDETKRTQ